MVISMFMGKDMFDYEIMSTKPITKGAGVFLALGLIILLTILCAGHKLNKMNSPATWMVALFGMFTFFFGVLPFFAESAAIGRLGSITQKDVDMACRELNSNLDDL